MQIESTLKYPSVLQPLPGHKQLRLQRSSPGSSGRGRTGGGRDLTLSPPPAAGAAVVASHLQKGPSDSSRASPALGRGALEVVNNFPRCLALLWLGDLCRCRLLNSGPRTSASRFLGPLPFLVHPGGPRPRL
ncbi:hypothetical protein GHT09_017353 [Marmota monax]|uniref:Uncharacterized protein n=1 Tax=Marmota monax TaxID=9995 RepID=A0A834UUU1_MARMO|nr:hypothetical protein GHT09_017353 [Marmota monax]